MELDLLRRDFSVNAIAYNPNEGIVDLVGGLGDLENKVIKCIMNPETILRDDYLRILKAIRFQSQLGFRIDPYTYSGLERISNEVFDVSPDRIQSELIKILSGDYVEAALLDNKDVIGNILPEISDSIGFIVNDLHHISDVDHSL